jgi:hypothetical protein
MSSFNNTKYTNNSGSTGTKRPVYKSFCKVCQDAGKPESTYTNHNVRQSQDKNSPVTCPTLLAQECRVCYKRGHSSKYCPQNQGQSQSQSQPLAAALVKKPTFQPKTAVRQAPKNVFMVFDEEDAKDELQEEVKRIIDEENKAKEARLRKVAPAPVKPAATPFSFAKIIAAAPALNHTDALRKAFAESVKAKSNKPKAVFAADNQKPKFSWADCDSGSDCDEEEETETSAW